MYVFTAQQMVDLRRFCGYIAYGDGSSGMNPWLVGYAGGAYFTQPGAFEYRMSHLSNEEGATVVSIFLTPLYDLEQAILTTADNIDTDKAAVWTHNKNEMAERIALFNDWRRRLCDFVGVPRGPALKAGGIRIVA